MHDIASPRRKKNAQQPKLVRPSVETALQLSAGRVKDIAALHGLGFTYREIAEHFHVSPQAVSILLERSRRQIDAIGGLPELAGLSTRASSALRRLGVTTPQEAATCNVLARLRTARNCGAKTLDEISSWMLSAATPAS